MSERNVNRFSRVLIQYQITSDDFHASPSYEAHVNSMFLNRMNKKHVIDTNFT
mgnify:CR=1 FL=1